MNDRDYRVIGVMPASFEPLDAERFFNACAELWAPLGYDPAAIRRAAAAGTCAASGG